MSLKCYRLAEPDKELVAGYATFTNDLLHTTSLYYWTVPSQTALEIVLPHSDDQPQRKVQSIVVWTSSNKPDTGYGENEFNLSVEYRAKSGSEWKPVSEIVALNSYAARPVSGATRAYGYRVEMARRDGSALLPAAAALRIVFGETSTGIQTRIGEIQVLGGPVASRGLSLVIR